MAHFADDSSGEGATVLDNTTNMAVVKLAGRKFPGVLLQGDTLSTLRCDIAESAELLRAADPEQAAAIIGGVLERLDELLLHYEKALRGAGYDLPYEVPCRPAR